MSLLVESSLSERTCAQKIFDAHLVNYLEDEFIGAIQVDRVFCHEITTPSAILELQDRHLDSVFDNSKIKAVIDHVSPAKDSKTALQGKILREWARKNDIEFFDIGRGGVCHALFPENGFIEPGFVTVMGDSHTCTYGAFASLSFGIGTTDLAVAIRKGICRLSRPQTIKIELSGHLKKGVFAKDVILFLISQIGVNGATGKVLEFSGSIIDSFSMESRMTLCNMAVECGATTGICNVDLTTIEYLWPFIKNRYENEQAALQDFSQWNSDLSCEYDEILKFDLSNLEPMVTFSYKPDCVKTVGHMSDIKVNQVFIGSCTNGRIEDLRVCADIIKQYEQKNGKAQVCDGVRAIVVPATSMVYKQALSEGLIALFVNAGFCVSNPSCAACIGMSCGVLAEGEVCASTTNRNFYGRMGKGGMIHLVSPATATSTALAGYITNFDFNSKDD